MSVSLEELKKNNSGNNYEKGYRIVYFYDNYYKVGEYCKTIDGFIIGFAKCNPIIDDDIPKFISTNDLLYRYLKDVKGTNSVAIYDVNGTCIDKVYRKKVHKLVLSIQKTDQRKKYTLYRSIFILLKYLLIKISMLKLN